MVEKTLPRTIPSKTQDAGPRQPPDLELWRALWHTGSISACGFLAGLLPKEIGAGLILFFVCLFGYWEVRRRYNPDWNFQGKAFFRIILRPDEKKGKTASGFDFLVGLLAVYFFVPTSLVQLTLFMVAFADPAGRVFGKLYDTPALPGNPRKTIAGSLGCLLLALAVGSIASGGLGLPMDLVMFGALMATLAEALPDRWMWLSDNFRMMLITGLSLNWWHTGCLLPPSL